MSEQFERLRAGMPAWAWDAGVALIAAAIGIALSLLAHRIFYRLLKRLTRSSESRADDIVVSCLERPTRYAAVALGVVLAARETPALDQVWANLAGFVMPALVGWIALAVLHGLTKGMELRADISVPDNLHA